MKKRSVSSDSYEECAPRPEAMISSLRAFGYDLPMAVADLIDNSIYAQSQNIAVDYAWNGGDPWFRIVDDGNGMSEGELLEAMRLGSRSPLDHRNETDLGRFGLGLKTASFSQCKLLTVYSKNGSDQVALRSWDLDHVCRCGKWEIGKETSEETFSLLSVIDDRKKGTVVLCQKLDRLVRGKVDNKENVRSVFLEEFYRVSRYLEMVFHRYMTGRDSVKIQVGRHVCKPWDPFLKRNEFTQLLSQELLDNNQIEIRPYILPHVSKRTKEETEHGSGLYGWNAQQGFYVYRNRRMIIPGGYLDLRQFKPEEHFKLCRIKVDLPNKLDHEWRIDVRKAAASPPSNVRRDLIRIAKATRNQAAEVYRTRAGGKRTGKKGPTKHDVWIRRKRGEKIIYEINCENEAINRIVREMNPPASLLKSLFHIIEKSVPCRMIVLDNSENEDCQINLPHEINAPPKALIQLCCEIFKDHMKKGHNANVSADYACSFFDEHPAYRAALDIIIEETT